MFNCINIFLLLFGSQIVFRLKYCSSFFKKNNLKTLKTIILLAYEPIHLFGKTVNNPLNLPAARLANLILLFISYALIKSKIIGQF